MFFYEGSLAVWSLAVYLKERRETIVNENVEFIRNSYHPWIYILWMNDQIIINIRHLIQQIKEYVALITPCIPCNVWRKLRYRLDFRRANNGAHI